ncbi:MAG: glycosyltransferase [Bacteroidetes bacterium]|nr:glycosyltransferase [Bacteroidota bacterium]
MRLLVSGSKKNTNTVGAFIYSNIDNFIHFEILSFPDRFTELMESLPMRFIYLFFPRLIVDRMDKLFVNQVKHFKPDAVLILKGMEISKRSLSEVQKLNVKLVNYNLDHPFTHFSKGTGNRFVEEAIPYYDLHISYSSIIAQQLHEHYGVRTAVLPFGYQLTDQQFEKIIQNEPSEINEVCFVGNPDELRITAFKELMKSKIKVNLYGFGWEKSFEESEWVTIHKPRKGGSFWADPLEFWKVIRQYRVQLNFFRPHNEGSHNLRTFEVPSVGGILLTPDSGEQRQFFEGDSEIFFYSDITDMINQCRRLLNMNQSQVYQIRENARSKSVSKDYSYKRRTNDLVQLLSTLIEEKK